MSSGPPLQVPGGESLSDLRHLVDVRYMAVAGISAQFYDLFLTISDEYETIWAPRRWNLAKIIFVFYRLSACIWTLLYMTFLFPRVVSNNWCNVYGIAVIVLEELVETLGNGIIFYELVILWGGNRRMSWMMAAGFILVHSATLLSVGITIAQVDGKLLFLNLPIQPLNFHMCISTISPSAFKGIYIPAVAFHVYAFVLLLLNVLARPRSSSKGLLDLLLGDGLIFFSISLGMRLMCLVLNVAAPPSLGIIEVGLSSSVVTTAVSRLYFRLNNPRNVFKNYVRGDEDDSDGWLQEETELQARNGTGSI